MSKARWKPLTTMVVTLGVVGVVATFLILQFGGPAKAQVAATIAPASQTAPVKEGELNVLTLTPEAEVRLALKTEPLTTRAVGRPRLLPGEIVLPSGRTVTAAAPFAGTVRAAEGESIQPGRKLAKGQAVFTLQPILTNEARTSIATSLVDAEGLVATTDVQLGAAKVALDRARRLAEEAAGPARAVDDAKAAFDTAKASLESARARRELLTKAVAGNDAGARTSINIDAPNAGVVRSVFVAPGQLVSAGTPLLEIVNQDVLWLRVAIYAGGLGEVARDHPATFGRLGAPVGEAVVSAKPISAPPAADAAGATTDLFYEIDNSSGVWIPGQRVAATVPLNGEAQGLVVPWSAVVTDVNAGQWVYECVAPHKYVRRRVQVRHVVAGDAVLASGPAAGTSVVTQGVAELFGREMGFAK